MAAGKINLQANDGAVVGLVLPDGLGSGDEQIGLKKDINTAGIELKTIATGTATFTATTNNINLTGIGIGIEIGDVIQISGASDAKNNSEFTIEVITDENNIIVNQAHANKGTTKNVATRASDTGVTVKLLAKWHNAPVGLGQGWVDVTSSRTTGVTYPTPLNRSIAISTTVVKLSGSGYNYNIINNGQTVGYIYNTITNDNHLNIYANIAKGDYKATNLIGSVTIGLWSELR